MSSVNSLRRRLKKRVLTGTHSYFAICAPGLEEILIKEALALPNAEGVWTTTGGVGFSGPIDTAYDANVRLNTAHRVLLRLGEFAASTFPMLFDQIRRIEWELWIPNGGRYRIRVATRASKLNMRKRIIDTCSRGIEDRLGKLGIIAQCDQSAPLVFAIRIAGNRAVVSLDTSGDLLHKRGYKRHTGRAPIRETIASAILMKARFYRFKHIVDPFCGSGTILLEALRMADGIPPGVGRDFGFQKTPFYRPRKLADARRSAQSSAQRFEGNYFGYDISPTVLLAAAKNLEQLDTARSIDLQEANFFELNLGQVFGHTTENLLVTNLPYEKRAQLEGGEMRQVIEHLVQTITGWTVALVSARDLGSVPGLSPRVLEIVKTGEVTRFYNGGLPTYLHIFKIW